MKKLLDLIWAVWNTFEGRIIILALIFFIFAGLFEEAYKLSRREKN